MISIRVVREYDLHRWRFWLLLITNTWLDPIGPNVDEIDNGICFNGEIGLFSWCFVLDKSVSVALLLLFMWKSTVRFEVLAVCWIFRGCSLFKLKSDRVVRRFVQLAKRLSLLSWIVTGRGERFDAVCETTEWVTDRIGFLCR